MNKKPLPQKIRQFQPEYMPMGRGGIDADDYSDPGWYKNPPGEMACEWIGALPAFASDNRPKTILTPKPTSKG